MTQEPNTLIPLPKTFIKEEAALKGILLQIVENDTIYTVRDGLIFDAMKLARAMYLQTSIYVDPKEGPLWPVFCISLPNVGQVSWHMSNQLIPYDGHSTEEKLERCRRYATSE